MLLRNSGAQLRTALGHDDPNLVRENLAGDPDGEMRKAATDINLDKVLDSGKAPSTDILSPVKATVAADEVIVAQARVTDAGAGVGRIEWRVNGVTVGIGSSADVDKAGVVTQTIALEPGENTIEVVAYNALSLLASLPASTTITWAPAGHQPKPKLFVISVGINAYGDMLFRPLRHAVADAKALGAAMRLAGKDLYADVEITYVLDTEATAQGMEQAIDAIGAKMHPCDTVIFFIAAHGKSENGRFHLIPQDYRSANNRNINEGTIGQDKLQDWFANHVKARRGIILLDTCESGALVASRASGSDSGNADVALGRLNEATGRPVLTAAAADQAALEGYRGHGIFTYALLDALVNGDVNNNGQIELGELVAHIQSLAPQLTHALRIGPVDHRSRAALALGPTAIATRYQKPKIGSRGEDFSLVKRLVALPESSAAQ
jgi:hypothetical protein